MSPLEEGHRAPQVRRHVPVHRHLLQQLDQMHRRAFGGLDQGDERPAEPVEHEAPEVVPRLGEQAHQLVDRRMQMLTEHPGAVVRRHPDKVLRRERAVDVEPLLQQRRQRDVARLPPKLRHVRVPTRTEVDCVEGQRELDVDGRRLTDVLTADRPRECPQPLVVDPNQFGALGDERAPGTDVVRSEGFYSPSSALMAP
ncbi:MAG TPA: hypothetical protein VKJ07_10620 [Mycobacteriales bacterium]|nr:hypothetical protein [Mycobacteriales bacterium]